MSAADLTPIQRSVLDELQGNLPDGLDPYAVLAARLGVDVEAFLSTAGELLRAGYLRKVAAAINHRRVGFMANAMCVWRIPAERVAEVGERIASFPEVTHCYQRPVSDAWPYAVFSMVHGRTRDECQAVIDRIAQQVGIDDHAILYSTRELKKRSLRASL